MYITRKTPTVLPELNILSINIGGIKILFSAILFQIVVGLFVGCNNQSERIGNEGKESGVEASSVMFLWKLHHRNALQAIQCFHRNHGDTIKCEYRITIARALHQGLTKEMIDLRTDSNEEQSLVEVIAAEQKGNLLQKRLESLISGQADSNQVEGETFPKLPY